MKTYREYIESFLRAYAEADPFGVDVSTGDVLLSEDLQRLADTAAEWAYTAAVSGGAWDGKARIVSRRRPMGGIYAEFLTIAPTVPCGLPTICLYCPARVTPRPRRQR